MEKPKVLAPAEVIKEQEDILDADLRLDDDGNPHTDTSEDQAELVDKIKAIHSRIEARRLGRQAASGLEPTVSLAEVA